MARYETYSRRFKLPARGGGPLTHSPDARILTIVDDYDDRMAGNTDLTPDKRLYLFFEPFESESYPYLRKRRMAVLRKAPVRGTLQEWLARSEEFSGRWKYDPENEVVWVFHNDVNNRDPTSGAPTGGDSEEASEKRAEGDPNLTGLNSAEISVGNAVDSSREARLFDAIRQPLTDGLRMVHEKLERWALTAGIAEDGVRRVRLVVRLGRLLFSAQGRRNQLAKIPPFSAQRLEDYMNADEKFRVPIHRVFETNVPDDVCSTLEDLASVTGAEVMAGAGVACRSSEKYDIQVLDTWSRTIYRAVCKYDADERQFHIKKVKKFPVRYAVIEIARPGKDLDVRFILTIETHLTALDESLAAAFSKVFECARINPASPGGVSIPEHMIEGQRGFDVPSSGGTGSDWGSNSDCSSIGSSTSSTSAGSSRRIGSTSLSPGGSSSSNGEESGRFQVRAVRHVVVRKVVEGGRVWKFSRVDGIEYKQGGGRKTKIVEVCPVAWQQQLKGGTSGVDGGRQQHSPTWSTEGIMEECPGLLVWLAESLP